MDNVRIFEQSELTTLVVEALNLAIIKTSGLCPLKNDLLSDLENLRNRIKNEKMDVRLVHREE